MKHTILISVALCLFVPVVGNSATIQDQSFATFSQVAISEKDFGCVIKRIKGSDMVSVRLYDSREHWEPDNFASAIVHRRKKVQWWFSGMSSSYHSMADLRQGCLTLTITKFSFNDVLKQKTPRLSFKVQETGKVYVFSIVTENSKKILMSLFQ